MKRQRHHGAEAPKIVQGATMTMPSKKTKIRTVSNKVKEEPAAIKVEEGISIDGGNDQLMAAQAAAAAAAVESYSSCSNHGEVLFDEQMSWGSIWSPLWDVELMGEAHYGLFSDHVVWHDDDIWGLRTTGSEIQISKSMRLASYEIE